MAADKCTQSKPSSCYINPPCGCRNPGKEIECENCEHLEACLSRTQAKPLNSYLRFPTSQKLSGILPPY